MDTDTAQLPLQPAVLRLHRFHRSGDLTGRQLVELLAPVMEAVDVDAQFGGDLPNRLAAEHQMLNGRALKVLIIMFSGSGFVTHVCWSLAHTFRHSLSTKSRQAHKSGKSTFEFAPSIRAISTIEEFYSQRMFLYKYVIYHHRVVKFDALLRETIVGLAKAWLDQKDRYYQLDPDKDNNLLPTDISGLWKILDPKMAILPRTVVNYYTQWDDFWLLTVLRTHFFKESANSKKKLLHIQLEEILSNHKFYYSLFKRVDSFLEIDKTFIEEAMGEAINGILEPELIALIPKEAEVTEKTSLKTAIRELVLFLKKYKIASDSNDEFRVARLFQRKGFFLTQLVNLLTSLGVSMEWVSTSAKSLQATFKLDDVFVIHKRLRPGIKSEMHLAHEEGFVKMANVSGIAEKLRRDANLFPPFFVYYYKEDEMAVDVSLMKKALGKELFEQFRKKRKEIQ